MTADTGPLKGGGARLRAAATTSGSSTPERLGLGDSERANAPDAERGQDAGEDQDLGPSVAYIFASLALVHAYAGAHPAPTPAH